MSFLAEIKASLGWNWNEAAVYSDRVDYAKSLADGNGDNQAEAAWHSESQLLLSAASLTLDLTALTRAAFGDSYSVTFLTVKGLLIINESTTGGGELLLGAATSDEWSEPFGADGDQIAVPPDSPLLLANRVAGWTVDNANKNLRLAAVGGDVTYSIAIIGTTSASGSGSGS